MAGPAIRCVEIAKVLSEFFTVKLCAPRIDDNVSFSFEMCSVADSRFKPWAKSADIIIVQGDALRTHPFLKKNKATLVADLYCPVPLEYHQASEGLDLDVRGGTSNFLSDVLHEQLVYADHFLCASEKQLQFWLGALTLAGRVNAHRWPQASHANVSDLISILPFGLSALKPVLTKRALRSQFDIPHDDFVLVWGGGLYQWFDPLTPIRAVHRLVSEGRRVHLVFIGVTHPNPDIVQHDMCARAVELASELGLSGKFVHFNFGWVDYHDRHNFLLDADIGISSHFDNPETRFSFRTRMLDYLWCGLPIIATKGDVFGDALAVEQVGIAVDYEDEDAWVKAIAFVMNDRNALEKFHKKSLQYSERFHWDLIVRPLVTRFETILNAPDRTLVRRHYLARTSSVQLFSRLRQIHASGGVKSLFFAFYRRTKRVFK
ncbi:glycosyltransferase family 4 protein [Pseudomonas sp. Irchel 3A7]|uniref:glycosyltransferase family 4 protein n=1 Tax=Pseudomonas sp. Irchel 3A7 TaxID=2008913 RepID=UPI001481F1FF|nr:glycosyltransferase family 4 protein [Pseudomonas sp. Irchel 3A7]